MKRRKLFSKNPVAEHYFLLNWLSGMRLFALQLQNLLLDLKFHCIEEFHTLGLSAPFILGLKI